MVCKVEIFCRDVQCRVRIQVLFDVLEYQGGFADTSWSGYTDHSAVPIYFGINVSVEVGLCFLK